MNKVVKKTGKVLLWILAVLIVIILALPLWIGPVVKGVANSIVPGKTGTTFNLGTFGLNPYSGVLTVGDMQLGSPEGYGKDNAVELGQLSVNVGMLSLPCQTMHVESIDLDGLFVYASGFTAANFRKIAANAAGDKDAKIEEEDEVAAKEEKERAEKAAKEDEKKSEAGGKRVVIDRVTLKNVKIKIGKMPAVAVPEITLTDLGKASDKSKGMTMKEMWETILNAVLGKASALGGALGDLGKGALKGLGTAGGATVDAMKNAGGATADAMKNAGGATVDAMKNAGGATVDAMKNAGGATVDAMKNAGGATVDAMKNAGGALKGLFKKD